MQESKSGIGFMKILMLNNFFTGFSGVEPIMMQESSLLKNDGHEVYFFASNKKPYFEEDYEYAKYFPEYINYPKLSKKELLQYAYKLFYNKEAEKKMKNYLKEIKPDLVHCHNVIFLLTPSVLKACYDLNIPVAYTVHGPDFVCPSDKLMLGGKTYCKDELCVGKNPIHCTLNNCFNDSLLKSLVGTIDFATRGIHKLYSNADIYICPSKALSKLVIKSGIPEEKVTVINNFVSNSYLAKEPNYDNKGYFLFAGRLTREKGVHYLLHAMAKLPDINLRIAGTGSQQEELKELAKELNLKNVEFIGFKSGKDLEDEYTNCIASILPCNWFENFGVALLESFISGKPIIASNIGGIPEIIDHGQNGLLVEPGNIDQIAESIKKINDDKQLAVTMGQHARQKAERLYTAEVHYSKLLDAYKKILGDKWR